MRQRILPLLALTSAFVMGAGAPVAADPPHAESATGTLTVVSSLPSVERVAADGRVLHLDIDLVSQLSGDITQSVTEHYECVIVRGTARCVGEANGTGPSGETTARLTFVCDATNTCTGRTRFRGVDASGQRLVGTGTFESSGATGTGTYDVRILRP